MNREIYIDLDNVLADWQTYALQIWPQYKNNIIQEDTVILELWNDMVENHPTFYYDLPLMVDAYELWDYFTTAPKILTAIPSRIRLPNVVTHKRDWVHQYFGDYVDVKFGPFAVDKQFHCNPGDILIDDKIQNIEQWNAREGVGILHVSAKDTIIQLDKLHIHSVRCKEKNKDGVCPLHNLFCNYPNCER